MGGNVPAPAKNPGAIGGFLTGDPLTMLVGGLLGKRGGAPDPSYAGQIDVGGPFQPTAYTGPSLDAFTGTPTGGSDVSSAGPAEAFFANTGASMMGPTMSEAYALDAESQLAGPSASQGASQNAQAALGGPGSGEQLWNQMQGRMQNPTNSQQAFESLQGGPGFDAFYDRARERQAGGINDQLAARGQFGSSAGLDQISQGMADLNAQQANREADFMLQQQGQMLQGAGQADVQNQGLMGLGIQGANAAQNQQLARYGLLGQLAGQEDQSQLSRALGLGDLVGQADQARIGQFGTAAGAAQGAGAERFGRIGLGVSAQQNAINQFANVLGPSLMAMLGADESLFNNAVAGEVGTLGAGTGFSRTNYLDAAQDLQNNIGVGMDAFNAVASAIPMM